MKDEGEKRQQMMENLFGVNSEDEEEEEVDSERESNQHRPNDFSDEYDGVAEQEIQGEAYVEGQGEAEGESEGEYHEEEPEVGESEGEREQSSQEVNIGDQHEESEARETDSDEKEDYAQKGVTSRRRDVIDSGSERSEEQEPHYIDPEDEEIDQTKILRASTEEEGDLAPAAQSAAEIRDVFGDSDEEELADYGAHHDIGIGSPIEEEESYGKDVRPDDLVHDDVQYGSEEDIVAKPKEKPVGPPLELEIPLRPPPALPDKVISGYSFRIQFF